tara:strand:- start:1029 stop:1814 length:786 start_codon:yes stop_codon:yes gene_type:complete
MIDPYNTLGVSKNATDTEIKSAYRRLAKQYHPDAGGNESKFSDISNAYNYIKDANSRQNFENKQFDPSNFQQSQNAFSQNFGNFNDIFNQMFTQNVRQRPPTSIVYHVEIEDVFNSATKNLNISLPNSSITKPVKITIPKGILSGQEVIYQGMSPNGGDLIVKFIIKQKEGYYVVKHDVIQKLEISLKEAMIGTERIIQTLDKKQIKLQIKSGTQSGTKLRIPQCGLPRSNLPNGDFIIEVYVKIPKLVNKDLDKTFNQVL